MLTELVNTSDKAIRMLVRMFIKKEILITRRDVKIEGQYYHGHTILFNKDFKIYCLFKKEYFKTFGRQFLNFKIKKRLSGIGDSINEKAIKYAVKTGCKLILFIHPTEIKCIDPINMVGICEKHNLKYTQDLLNPERIKKGKYKGLHEYTYSIPKEYLKDFSLKELL